MSRKYSIPSEFDSALRAYGPDPDTANWTSYPQYAYDQFYRGPETKPNPKKGKKRKAAKNPRNFERAEVASQMFQSSSAPKSSLFSVPSSGRHPIEMPEGLNLQRATWHPPTQSRSVFQTPVDMPVMSRPSASTEAAPIVAPVTVSTVSAASKPYVPVPSGSWSTKTEYQLVAPNAGPFLPGMFPYGMQGRPATYKNPRKTKKNSAHDRYRVEQTFGGYIVRDGLSDDVMRTFEAAAGKDVAAADRLAQKKAEDHCIKLNAAEAKTNPGAFQLAMGLVAPIAMGVSYSRNKSILWAFLHGLIGLPYLVYIMATSLAGEKPKAKLNQAEARRVWTKLNPRQQKAIKAEVCQICESVGQPSPWPAAKKNSAEDEVHKLLREATAADKSGQRSRAQLLRARAATAAHGTPLAYHLRGFETGYTMAQANPGPRGGYTEAERERLEASDFAIPERRAWPLSNLVHGKLAIAYMKRGFGKQSEYTRIARAVAARYPNLAAEAKAAASRPISTRRNHNTFYREGQSSVGDRPVFFQTYAGARRNGTKSGGYPFADKQKQYAAYSDEQLSYARRDAHEAMKAMQGHDSEAEAWYADDVSTIIAEIQKRKK